MHAYKIYLDCSIYLEKIMKVGKLLYLFLAIIKGEYMHFPN
jgi:hypothetical protein